MQAHQQIDYISDRLGSLHIDPPEWLLFNPTDESSWLQETFNDVPRYLFRVYTPRSRGTTDRIWTKSMDSTDRRASSQLDIFARDNKDEVAGMLNRHLRWRRGHEDNFVSWTSSLLFAIVYIFHLHANPTDGSSLADISLCVVDTTAFPKGVFLRDLDLIRVFRTFNEDLLNFKQLRSRDYYFGEYLSQGALKIEGKCQIVSAQAMIDQGLYDLQPEFGKFASWEKGSQPPWAKPVLELRREFVQVPGERSLMSAREQDAAMNIAQRFGGRWKLPVAVNFMALRPRRSRDLRILEAFRAFSEAEREDFSPLRTKTIAPSTMPEVQQYVAILHDIHQDFYLAKMNDCTREAEIRLREARDRALNLRHGTPGGNSLTSIPQYAALQRQLDTIARLTQALQQSLQRPAQTQT